MAGAPAMASTLNPPAATAPELPGSETVPGIALPVAGGVVGPVPAGLPAGLAAGLPDGVVVSRRARASWRQEPIGLAMLPSGRTRPAADSRSNALLIVAADTTGGLEAITLVLTPGRGARFTLAALP
jgi:hypothetical protein